MSLTEFGSSEPQEVTPITAILADVPGAAPPERAALYDLKLTIHGPPPPTVEITVFFFSIVATSFPSGRLAGNLHRTRFHTLGERELDESHTALVDGFGSSDIAVLIDRDGDGRITAADGAIHSVAAANRQATFQPTPEDLDLVKGVRAGVIFYSAGRGETDTDLVLSWK